MNSCVKTGAIVHLVCHDLVFHADLYAVAGAIVVRANGPLVRDGNAFSFKQYKEKFCWMPPTHELDDRPVSGFWRDDLGVFIVPANQLRALE